MDYRGGGASTSRGRRPVAIFRFANDGNGDLTRCGGGNCGKVVRALGLTARADARPPAASGPSLPELPRRAVRAVERDLGRLIEIVAGEIFTPPLLVGRQPNDLAFCTARKQRDVLGPLRASCAPVSARFQRS